MRVTHLLTSAVLFFLFSSPAFAQESSSGDVKPNLALREVREISVVITSDSEPNKDGFNPSDLKSQVIDQLSKAGFKSTALYSSAIPDWLRIDLETLKVESCGQYVISVRTSLARGVTLVNGDERVFVIADVWKIDSGIRIMVAEKIVDEIPAIVREQVQTFIAACTPTVSVEKKSDVNQPRQQLRRATDENDTKPVKKQVVESKYVSSKNSQVFHKASCPSAKRISPSNLVSYATRDEAIAAGKKPCERCNP